MIRIAAAMLIPLARYVVLADMGPPFGPEWTATVAANMTQVGFDMGMVLVNFTGSCPTPSTQRAQTVYGDFYTLLLLCDVGVEYEIAPASRGGGCKKRVIGKDLDPRVCEVCSCPFCIRDSNREYKNTTWDVAGARRMVGGVDAMVWSGHQSSGADDKHHVSVAFSRDAQGLFKQPLATNISDSLWVVSRAQFLEYLPTVPDQRVWIPPSKCPPIESDERRSALVAPMAKHAQPTPAAQWQQDWPLERAALVDLATATNVTGWARHHNWLSTAHICDWQLVGCDTHGHVKLLALDFNNLLGTLPESIGDLHFLEDLDLEGNHVRGAIPTSVRLRPS